MGRSSLLGPDIAAPEPAGRDTAALGPGDSSDSGSDLVGIEDLEQGDPGAPVDVALRDDMPHPLVPGDALGGSASDAGGTGERRAAGADAGLREAADIGVDRIFTPGGSDDDGLTSDDRDAALAQVDEAEAGDPLEDEPVEDDDAEDDDDGSGGGLENEDDNIPR